jgi:hypothetical protein
LKYFRVRDFSFFFIFFRVRDLFESIFQNQGLLIWWFTHFVLLVINFCAFFRSDTMVKHKKIDARKLLAKMKTV